MTTQGSDCCHSQNADEESKGGRQGQLSIALEPEDDGLGAQLQSLTSLSLCSLTRYRERQADLLIAFLPRN